MKLLTCYYCDGKGWVEFEDAVDFQPEGIYIETDAYHLWDDRFPIVVEQFNCPDCLGRGWESPWRSR